MFEIFKNKRIIVTGHTGFKGSWLTAFLSTYKCKIYGLSKDIPTKPSHFKLLNFKNKVVNHKLDITDLKKLKKTCYKTCYKACYQAAAVLPAEVWHTISCC